MRLKPLLFVFVLLVWAGCSEDDYHPGEDMVEASFITSASGTNVSVTRVENSNWFTSDMVGIRMSGTGILDRFTGYKKFCPETAGTTVNLIPTANDQKLCYPTNGNTVTFTAFCPYDSSQNPDGGTVSYTLSSQTTSAAMEAVDLVYHTGATGSKSSPEVPLVFTHKFSKLTINVVCGAEVTNLGVALNNLNMTITNVPTAAVCTLADGTVAVSTVGTVSPYLQNLAATGKASAIIAPHAGGGDYTDRAITFKVGDLDYSYILPLDFEFEAAKEYIFNFTLTLTAPILTESTITDWTGGTIAWDGEGYKLTAPTEVVHYRQATTGNTIVIKTNHVNTPGIQYSTDATTVTGSSTVKGYLTQTNFEKTNDTSPYEWTLTYSLTETTTDREGYIHVSVAGMTVVTKVTQNNSFEPVSYLNGNTNCFMVAPGIKLQFPLTRPVEEAGTASETDVFTVEKLWDDTTGGAVSHVEVSSDAGADAVVTVTTGSKLGNALIAVKVDGTIVWSYHIWVTEYNPWAGATHTNAFTSTLGDFSFTFMDRNLGACNAGTGSTTDANLTHGLYYQWGRKDPFPYTANFSTTTLEASVAGEGIIKRVARSTETGTVEYAIANPITYIYQSGSDWLVTKNNSLWGNNSSIKSLYDPCPQGWRVPQDCDPSTGYGGGTSIKTSFPWYGLTGSFSYGFNYGTNAIYPAVGYRNANGSGNIQSRGTSGFYWTSSAASANADMISMRVMGTAAEKYIMSRCAGCVIRCCRE